jgi:hypothetical protein
MSAPTRAAEDRAARQRALALRAVQAADALWRDVRPGRITASWRTIAAQMVALLVAAQQASAQGAQEYVNDAVTELGGTSRPAGTLNVSAFAGWAADGRSLASLLDQPRITVLTNLAAGVGEQAAMQAGRYQLLRIVGSETADAGRSASGVGIITNRTTTGYVRVISPGACSRCVVLAGLVFHTSQAFKRHPHCQCVNEPTIDGLNRAHIDPDTYFRSLSAAEQDSVFTTAGAQAIRDGADISSVVNVRRRGAVYTADAYGRRVLATREGTTRRGSFYRAERQRAIDRGRVSASGAGFRLRSPRLMPEEIYRLAATREEALSMLRRFGYFR